MNIRKFFPAFVLLGLLMIMAPTANLNAAACPSGTESCSSLSETVCSDCNCIWNEASDECAGIYIASAGDVIDIINGIGNWIFAILMAVAGVMLILAGFFWVTAGGDPQNVTKARQMLTNAVIGLVIALLARGLVMAVLKVLGA